MCDVLTQPGHIVSTKCVKFATYYINAPSTREYSVHKRN